MKADRSGVTSSFTVVKGALVDETYSVFRAWDFGLSRRENLNRFKEANPIGAKSASWLRDVAKVLNRRFDPNGRDRPLVVLAQASCDREVWQPLLLWHMTRDELLVRDFLVRWLYPAFREGVFRVHVPDVIPYLEGLQAQGVTVKGRWSASTTQRVAAGLLQIATEFGLLTGKTSREFASYHLPDASLLYLLHAVAEEHATADKILQADDWKMFLMDSSAVEAEVLRLHQFRRLHYSVAGTLAQLELPCPSAAAYAQELAA